MKQRNSLSQGHDVGDENGCFVRVAGWEIGASVDARREAFVVGRLDEAGLCACPRLFQGGQMDGAATVFFRQPWQPVLGRIEKRQTKLRGDPRRHEGFEVEDGACGLQQMIRNSPALEAFDSPALADGGEPETLRVVGVPRGEDECGRKAHRAKLTRRTVPRRSQRVDEGTEEV